jgi:hypothetical protein
VVTPHLVFNVEGPKGAIITKRSVPSYSTPRTMAFINAHILHTSERVGKADMLLQEAEQSLEEYGSTIGSENRKMAEGLLTM